MTAAMQSVREQAQARHDECHALLLHIVNHDLPAARARLTRVTAATEKAEALAAKTRLEAEAERLRSEMERLRGLINPSTDAP